MGKGREEGRASSPRQRGAVVRHSERGAAPTAGRGEVVTRSWARKLGIRAEKLCDWRKNCASGGSEKMNSGVLARGPSWQRRRARNRPHALGALALALGHWAA
jgi:hypothetical protein